MAFSKFKVAGLTLLAVLASAPSWAAVGIYIYTGQGMNCIGYASSCVNQVPDPTHLIASFTFKTDFDQNYQGDQTQYAFAYNTKFVTDWSVSDGVRTLSSANGDTLEPTSSFTYNGGSMRTWAFTASNLGGSLILRSVPHADVASINGNIVIGRAVGDWSTGGGPAVTASVPEPASWAMMVGGFGMLGAAMRLRKVAVSFG